MDLGQFGAVGGRDRRADRTVALSYTDAVTQTACWEERSQVCDEIRLTLAEVRRRIPSAVPAWGPRGTTPRLTVGGTTAGAPPTPPPPTAPHRTAPHRTARRRTALHRTAPHRTAPHRTALHCTALQKVAIRSLGIVDDVAFNMSVPCKSLHDRSACQTECQCPKPPKVAIPDWHEGRFAWPPASLWPLPQQNGGNRPDGERQSCRQPTSPPPITLP